MNIAQILSNIDLTFSDYLLLAIILILLHGINVIELISIKDEVDEENRKTNLTLQSTIAFTGIIVTLLCGLIAQYLKNTWIDTGLVLFPLLFIIVWFSQQVKSSAYISLDKLHDKIAMIVENQIASYAENKGSFTLDQLHQDYKTIITADVLLRNISTFIPKRLGLRFEGLDEIFAPLKFDKNEIKHIIKKIPEIREVGLESYEYIAKENNRRGLKKYLPL